MNLPSLSSVNILDALLVVVFVYFVLRGMVRGFIMELSGLLAFVLAFAVAGNQAVHNRVAELFGQLLSDPSWSGLLAYVMVFLTVYFLINLAGHALNRALTESGGGAAARTGGGLAGLAKGFVLATLVLICLNYMAPHSQLRAESSLAGGIASIWDWVGNISGEYYRLPLQVEEI